MEELADQQYKDIQKQEEERKHVARGGFAGAWAERARPLLEMAGMLQKFEGMSPGEQRQLVDALPDETQREQLSALLDSGTSEMVKQQVEDELRKLYQ